MATFSEAALFIPMLVALLVFFLWLVVVVVLVRPFAVQLPLGPFSFGKRTSAFQALTPFQYVLICGVRLSQQVCCNH
jgi:hypothetical protein